MLDSPEFIKAFEQTINDILVWVGFGTLAGLLAKAIMPGRDPGGTVATLMMGIGGTVIGSGTLMFFTGGKRITPISPLGFVVATAGAFIILGFYRILAGYYFREGTTAPPPPQYARRATRRGGKRGTTVYIDD
ncbi:MAG: GlsB/YeaQ/YmgE family stress response membrane protein [Planctomycetes bacterium]|nr:GlsB/YeaQ/YmgE family stress response membrane protein [Planctomycetota bacterium]